MDIIKNGSRMTAVSLVMGISVPATQYIVELAAVFKVSTDYLLGMDDNASISVKRLNDEDIRLVYGIVKHLKKI